eukprot:TRINITY_DN22406_c0_g1_i1.p1 TRINITY_DN22406_c0_g1~~TRINITY_DN22406_c0_g1_i1.p1  ORF type:complete len:768 (+),score=155.95 TRINITY_DN22406_c0_g1_i1:159-2462(+)
MHRPRAHGWLWAALWAAQVSLATGASLYANMVGSPTLSEMKALFDADQALKNLVVVDTDTTTLFAPDNAAFAKLGDGYREALEHVPAVQEAFVRMHIVLHNKIETASFVNQNRPVDFRTEKGTTLGVGLVGAKLSVRGDGAVTEARSINEVASGNGMLQIVDTVLDVPGFGLPEGSYSDTSVFPPIFGALVANIGVPKNGLTCLAPSDAAFTKIGVKTAEQVLLWPKSMLTRIVNYAFFDTFQTVDMMKQYSIYSTLDTPYTLSSSTATGVLVLGDKAKIISTRYLRDGALHVTDAVLEPDGIVFPTLPLLALAELPSVFKALIDYARMGEVLTRSNTTVLAPSDAAFAAVGVSSPDEIEDVYSFAEAQWIVQTATLRGMYSVERFAEVALSATPRLSTLTATTLLLTAANKMDVVISSTTTVNNKPRITQARVNNTVVATDGMLHITDAVMLPDNVEPMATRAPETDGVNMTDVIIVIVIGACLCAFGCYFVYMGSIRQYLKNRRDEAENQQVRIAEEAMVDDMMKKRQGANYNNFRSLNQAALQAQEEGDKPLKNVSRDNGSEAGSMNGVARNLSNSHSAGRQATDDLESMGNQSNVNPMHRSESPGGGLGIPLHPQPSQLSSAGTGREQATPYQATTPVFPFGLSKTGDSPLPAAGPPGDNPVMSPASDYSSSPFAPSLSASGQGGRPGYRSGPGIPTHNKNVYGMGYGKYVQGQLPPVPDGLVGGRGGPKQRTLGNTYPPQARGRSQATPGKPVGYDDGPYQV